MVTLDGGTVREVQFEEWRGPRWPIWRYAIARPSDARFRTLRYGLRRDDPGEWTGGFFVNVSTPRDDPDAPRMYRPTERAAALLNSALTVDTTDEMSLLAFVNQWGLLGVGLGTVHDHASLLRQPQARSSADSVWATRRALEMVQSRFRWLRALQGHRWSSPDIPALALADRRTGDEATIARRLALIRLARSVVPPPDHGALGLDQDPANLHVLHIADRVAMFGHEDPYLCATLQGADAARAARHPHRGHRRSEAERHWRAFAVALRPHLRAIAPTIEWHTKGRPIPAFHVRRPVDVLWVGLWDLATKGAQTRRCKHCHGWFTPSRRGKVYCSPECANRASSKAWYEAKGRRLRQQRRTKGGDR